VNVSHKGGNAYLSIAPHNLASAIGRARAVGMLSLDAINKCNNNNSITP
jgi:hypothetical protein